MIQIEQLATAHTHTGEQMKKIQTTATAKIIPTWTCQACDRVYDEDLIVCDDCEGEDFYYDHNEKGDPMKSQMSLFGAPTKPNLNNPRNTFLLTNLKITLTLPR